MQNSETCLTKLPQILNKEVGGSHIQKKIIKKFLPLQYGWSPGRVVFTQATGRGFRAITTERKVQETLACTMVIKKFQARLFAT